MHLKRLLREAVDGAEGVHRSGVAGLPLCMLGTFTRRHLQLVLPGVGWPVHRRLAPAAAEACQHRNLHLMLQVLEVDRRAHLQKSVPPT